MSYASILKNANQGVATTDSPTFAGLTTTGAATIGGNTEVDGVLTVDGATEAILNMDAGSAGQAAWVQLFTNGSGRWVVGKDNTAESGSNAGSNFTIYSFNDAGGFLGTPLSINRATGKVTLGGDTEVDGNLTIDGSGDCIINVDANASGNAARVLLLTNNSVRWSIAKNNGAETGSDAGSNFQLSRYDDTGAYIADAIFINRSDGYINIPGVYAETTASAANVFVGTDGSLRRSTSSLRYKINVEDMTYGLKDVLALRPVTYSPKPNGENDDILDTRYGGLIAEEVDAAGLKEFVGYNDEGQPDSLHYGHMVALCIKAIQELKAEVDELRSKLNG